MAQDSTTALREQLVEAVERLLLAGVMSHSRSEGYSSLVFFSSVTMVPLSG